MVAKRRSVRPETGEAGGAGRRGGSVGGSGCRVDRRRRLARWRRHDRPRGRRWGRRVDGAGRWRRGGRTAREPELEAHGVQDHEPAQHPGDDQAHRHPAAFRARSRRLPEPALERAPAVRASGRDAQRLLAAVRALDIGHKGMAGTALGYSLASLTYTPGRQLARRRRGWAIGAPLQASPRSSREREPTPVIPRERSDPCHPEGAKRPLSSRGSEATPVIPRERSDPCHPEGAKPPLSSRGREATPVIPRERSHPCHPEGAKRPLSSRGSEATPVIPRARSDPFIPRERSRPLSSRGSEATPVIPRARSDRGSLEVGTDPLRPTLLRSTAAAPLAPNRLIAQAPSHPPLLP